MAIELVETVEVTTAATLIELNSIPQDGTHLFCVISVRSSSQGATFSEYLSINHDTSSSSHNYRGVSLSDSGTFINGATSQNTTIVVENAGNASTANHFGTGTIWFYDYTDSTNKMYVSYGGPSFETISANWHLLQGARYDTTNAITSLRFFTSGNHQPYSTISLYKVT